MFKNIQLITNKSIPTTKHGQICMSLANNFRTRLFTTQATHVSTNKNDFKSKFNKLLKDLDMLNYNN